MPLRALAELRHQVAEGCRILAHTGVTTPMLGHVSVRIDDGRVLVRCRGPRERGLLFTEAEDIRLVDLDNSAEVGEGYRLPHEYPIHAEILRARPEVASVVHAHPVSAVVADLAGLRLTPVVGAFNIPAHLLAAAGIPTHPRSGLVRDAAAGRSLVGSLAGAAACVLRGHGVVTVGDSPVESVLRALDVEELARLRLAVAQAGGRPDDVPEADRADLPDLGSAFNQQARWRYHRETLALAGLAMSG